MSVLIARKGNGRKGKGEQKVELGVGEIREWEELESLWGKELKVESQK